MKKYNAKIEYPIQSPGNVSNLRDIVVDVLEKYGLGVINPEKIYEFYNDFHGYLASIGIDGVKVDVQNMMETLGTGYGGRVSITRQYQEALEQSVVKNFKEANLICCMSHNSDSIYRFVDLFILKHLKQARNFFDIRSLICKFLLSVQRRVQLLECQRTSCLESQHFKLYMLLLWLLIAFCWGRLLCQIGTCFM